MITKPEIYPAWTQTMGVEITVAYAGHSLIIFVCLWLFLQSVLISRSSVHGFISRTGS